MGRLNEGEVLDPSVLPQYLWTGNDDVSPEAQYEYFLGSLTGNNLLNNPRTKCTTSLPTTPSRWPMDPISRSWASIRGGVNSTRTCPTTKTRSRPPTTGST